MPGSIVTFAMPCGAAAGPCPVRGSKQKPCRTFKSVRWASCLSLLCVEVPIIRICANLTIFGEPKESRKQVFLDSSALDATFDISLRNAGSCQRRRHFEHLEVEGRSHNHPWALFNAACDYCRLCLSLNK
jgi:hypothetical protein